VLGQAVISASRGKDTYLAAWYRRMMARRGRKRALVALQHSILIAVWHMFTNDMLTTTPLHVAPDRYPPDTLLAFLEAL
jgi:hypothetical protein